MSRPDEIWDAYRNGQADAERDGVFDKGMKDQANRLAYATFSSLDDNPDEELAYMKGYGGEELEICYQCERVEENCECEGKAESTDIFNSHDNHRENSDYRNSGFSSSSRSSGSTSWIGCFGFLAAGALALWGLYALSQSGLNRYWELKKAERRQAVWTMREVSATRLNVRSGPSANSSVVATLERGARLAVTGDPVKNGNDLWIRVSTDDGGIQGWANKKYINFGPSPLGPQTSTSSAEDTSMDPVATTPTTTGNPTPATAPAPLLVPVPYNQTQPQLSPSQSQSPDVRPKSTPADVRRVTTSPNIKMVGQDTPEGVPNKQQSEQSSDGIPKLKKRPPQ